MNYEEVAKEILEDVCETDEIFEDLDMDLFDAGFLDSLTILNIIVKVEDKMGVVLNPTDITKDNVRSVNAFIAYITEIGNKQRENR